MIENLQRLACQKRAQSCYAINFYHLCNTALARNNVVLFADKRACHSLKMGRQAKHTQAYEIRTNTDNKEGRCDVPRTRITHKIDW